MAIIGVASINAKRCFLKENDADMRSLLIIATAIALVGCGESEVTDLDLADFLEPKTPFVDDPPGGDLYVDYADLLNRPLRIEGFLHQSEYGIRLYPDQQIVQLGGPRAPGLTIRDAIDNNDLLSGNTCLERQVVLIARLKKDRQLIFRLSNIKEIRDAESGELCH